MVDLFFVLSGFVIYRTYAERIASWADLGRFQFLRFGRLYPVHLVMLGVFLLIECAKYLAALRGISSANSTPFGQNNPIALVEQLLLVQGLGPTGNKSSFNSAAWSISTEFYTYLIFALIVMTAGKYRRAVFGIVAVGSMLLLISIPGSGYFDLVRCEAGFFIGCLTAWSVRETRVRLPWIAPILIFAALIIFLCLKKEAALDPLIYILSALLIFALVLSEGPLTVLLKTKLLVGLGAISYSVYMCHEVIIWLANQVFRVLLRRPEHIVDGQTVPLTSGGEALFAGAIVLLIVITTSAVLYRRIEQPWREKSRSLVMNPVLQGA